MLSCLLYKVPKTIAALLAILVVLSTGLYAQVYGQSKGVKDRIAYINQYKDMAIGNMKRYGIPASITLAQGCLESGNGKSTLAVKANNHFGIKCHNDWDGPTIRHDDDAPKECFRKYPNASESYEDHSKYLSGKRRYASLFDLSVKDYKGWAKGLKAAGYATNPNYANELIKIIEDYELYKFDSGEYFANIDYEEMGDEKVAVAEEDMLFEGIADGAEPMQVSPLYAYSMDRQIYSDNGRAYIFANEGDTYEDIAKEYKLFNREIRKFNKVKKKNITLRAGDIVYLEKR